MKLGPRVVKATGFSAFVALMACSGARAGDDPFWDELSRYAERIDTASVASGDARNVNAVTQIIDPWPVYARDRRIPGNGQRMIGAINRYQNPKLLGAQAPTLAPIITTGSGSVDSGSPGIGGGSGP
jgi:hypothetical protein